MLERLRSTYLYICWLPLALYFFAALYVAASTGWGQWVTEVIALPSMLLSAAFLLGGLVILNEAAQKKEPLVPMLVATLVAGSVFLWFAGRSFLVTLLA